jgi:hypothetical protein
MHLSMLAYSRDSIAIARPSAEVGCTFCSNVGIGPYLTWLGLRTQHVRLTIHAHIDVSEPTSSEIMVSSTLV